MEKKTFQASVTTYSQSKRLLNIGMPEWTADFVDVKTSEGAVEMIYSYHVTSDDHVIGYRWTATRLIDILFMLSEGLPNNEVTVEEIGYKKGIIEALVQSFEVCRDKLQFIKLYEEND